MSAVFVEIQNYGDGKILKTATGDYRYMDADRNVSKKSYNSVGDLLDGEKIREDGNKARPVQERVTGQPSGATGDDTGDTATDSATTATTTAVVDETATEEKAPAKRTRKASTKK